MGARHNQVQLCTQVHEHPSVEHALLANSDTNRPIKSHTLEKEIKALLQKGAVHVTPMDATLVGFMSTFFLVPKKKTGSWRPTLNLKPLNTFIQLRPFQIDMLKVVLNLIQTPAWAASVDLKDAYMYLHIPIRRDH